MRFWLSEDERRPDPAPARADARKAVLAGTALWAIALVLSLVLQPSLDDAGLGWAVGAAATGVALGLIGLVVVQLSRRRRARQTAGGSRA